jgi:hypothetical protein
MMNHDGNEEEKMRFFDFALDFEMKKLCDNP